MLMMVRPKVLAEVFKSEGASASVTGSRFRDRFLEAHVLGAAPDTLRQDSEVDEAVIEDYDNAIVEEFVRAHRLRKDRLKFAPTEAGFAASELIYDYIQAVSHSGCGVNEEVWDKAGGTWSAWHGASRNVGSPTWTRT